MLFIVLYLNVCYVVDTIFIIRIFLMTCISVFFLHVDETSVSLSLRIIQICVWSLTLYRPFLVCITAHSRMRYSQNVSSIIQIYQYQNIWSFD